MPDLPTAGPLVGLIMALFASLRQATYKERQQQVCEISLGTQENASQTDTKGVE